MNNTRLLLWMTFSLMLWFTYQAWVDRYPTPVEGVPLTIASEEQTVQSVPAIQNLPQLTQPLTQAAPLATDAGEPPRTIRIQTDVFDALIDMQGGDLVQVELLDYPIEKGLAAPIRLLNDTEQDRWIFRTGARGLSGENEPNHQAEFVAEGDEYILSPGSDELIVRLDWTTAGPLRAQKVYTFRRGQYAVDLNIIVENQGDEAWSGAGYAQIFRHHRPVGRSFISVDSYSFTGPVLYDGEQFEKLDVEDLIEEPINQSLVGGWVAAIQHHFLAAAVPPPMEAFTYRAAAQDGEFTLTGISNTVEVPAGEREEFPFTLFVGPKLQEQLAAAGPSLELTVDYGMLTILARPLFWGLDRIYRVVGNWGWAIIIITMLIKLVFYKLTETSGRSMARMRKLQPRMKALQETYKDNREELSRHMMDLYKREKVNPAAGCLPILIQMPFFFAFYWVLIESVEIRQAPFMLWIGDLSSRDPYFVLPLLMGAAMLVQTRLNPAPPDPIQAKVMQIMPIMFTGFFAFFPAGLVLYWLTNTTLSILQQWRINKVIAD